MDAALRQVEVHEVFLGGLHALHRELLEFHGRAVYLPAFARFSASNLVGTLRRDGAAELPGCGSEFENATCSCCGESAAVPALAHAQTPPAPIEPVVVVSRRGCRQGAARPRVRHVLGREPIEESERGTVAERQGDDVRAGAARRGGVCRRTPCARSSYDLSSSPTGSTAGRSRAAMSRATRSKCGSMTSRALVKSSTSRSPAAPTRCTTCASI